MKRMITIWFMALTCLGLQGQSLSPEEVEYLNKEIRFFNESIHRMVIVFQVFENYNAKATKHVDLPTNQGILNTASHLPDNLFEDNNLVRSGDSPIKIYQHLSSDPLHDNFPINNWSLVERARGVIDFLSQDRDKLDQIIAAEDLDKFANIQTIYESIEEAMEAYDNMRKTVKEFEAIHKSQYFQLSLAPEQRQVYTALIELHYDIKKLARQLRDDNKSGVKNGISKIVTELGWLTTCVAKLPSAAERSDINSSVTSMEKIVDEIRKYVSTGEVPEEYKAYGGGYHYHNYNLLPLMNQYGSGYVWKLEEFFKKHEWGVIHFMEEPHFMKIIYPERIPIELMKGDKIDPETDIRDISPADDLPVMDELVVQKEEAKKDRASATVKAVEEEEEEEVKKEIPQRFDIVETRSIKTDTDTLSIQLYDHLKKDGDRVSIFVNGEWIHKMISLETSWTTIQLPIQSGKVNTILVRAENTGWNPPNTIAIKYGNGQVIRKDLKTYEAIELKVSLGKTPFFN